MSTTTFNAYKPLRQIFSLGGSTYDNDYINYTVSIGYYDYLATATMSWKTIYNGKSLVLNGYTEIDLSRIMVDYSNRINYDTDYNQNYIPINLNNFSDTLNSVEYSETAYANTILKIEFTYNDSAVLPDKELYITTYPNINIQTPYDNDDTYNVALYQSAIECHVPHIETDKYWIGIDFAKDNGQPYPLVYGDNCEGGTITTNGYGNYSTTYTLSDFFGTVEGDGATINIYYGTNNGNFFNGGSASVVNDTIAEIVGADLPTEGGYFADGDGIYLGYTLSGSATHSDSLIAKVDDCYDRWYMAWWYEGWHSVSVRNVINNRNSDNFNITNIYSEKKNIWTDVQNVYTVNTNRLSNDELVEYSNIMNSPYVVLYDTENDENHWCIINTNSIMVVKQNGYKTLQFELEEIITDKR